MTSSDKVKKPASTSRPTYQFEAEWADDGPVIGIDEAGEAPGRAGNRGGILDLSRASRYAASQTNRFKKLTAPQRADIEAELCNPANGHLFAIHHSPVDEIDRNGYSASYL